MKMKYLSPTCELRSVNGKQLLCASSRSVTVDGYELGGNEIDW